MNKEINKLENFHEVITSILYHYDPPQLSDSSIPEDEYSSEAAAIISKLHGIEDIRALKWMVYDVFKAYFFKENILPLSHECYTFIAEKIWEEWEKVKYED